MASKIQINNKVSFTKDELSKTDLYFMTQGKESKSLKDVEDNTIIDPIGYVEFLDIKDDGTDSEVFAIMDADGAVFTTVSKTFMVSFKNIAELMLPDHFIVKKISGTTKNGREYIDCELVV